MNRTIASFFGASLLGLVLFYIVTGGFSEVLNDRLIVDTDYPNAAAAFRIYVVDQWRFPIGSNPRFGETNIFFSDASPVYAILAKGVDSVTGFSLSFNYLIIINFLLFGVFSFRLGKQVSDDPATQWLIAALLTFNLVMPSRIIGGQHIALGSYWVILWAMTSVHATKEFTKVRSYEPFACVLVSILSHAYLGAMTVGIVTMQLIWKKRYISTIASLLIPMVILPVFGVFQEGHTLTHGAKAWGLDLAAYFYSLNWAYTGDWYEPENVAQKDIFLYLGTGVMLLMALSLIARILETLGNRRISNTKGYQVQSNLYALILIAVLLALYGMAFDITVAGHRLVSIGIPQFLEPLYQRFRVAGRFGVVLCYVLITLTVLWWGRKRSRNGLWWFISVVAIVLQVTDAFHAFRYATHRSDVAIEERNAQSNAVSTVLKDSKWTGRVIKKVDFADLESQRLLDYLLLQHGATQFSAVHSARANPRRVTEQMERSAFTEGDLLITKGNSVDPTTCERTSHVKEFHLCLVR